jgi:hypothetical protein
MKRKSPQKLEEKNCLRLDSAPGLPDFSWFKLTKMGKIYQMNTTYAKRPEGIQNGRKIFQMVIQHTNILHSKTFP